MRPSVRGVPYLPSCREFDRSIPRYGAKVALHKSDARVATGETFVYSTECQKSFFSRFHHPRRARVDKLRRKSDRFDAQKSTLPSRSTPPPSFLLPLPLRSARPRPTAATVRSALTPHSQNSQKISHENGSRRRRRCGDCRHDVTHVTAPLKLR